MHASLGDVSDREIYSIRVSDNMMVGTPLLIVGDNSIVKIKYHEPCGEGDKHFADVDFENGVTTRFFDIINIQFHKKGTI